MSVTLEDIQTLITRMETYDDGIADVERELAALKASRDDIAMVQLPEALDNSGFSEVKLPDGRKLEVDTIVSASVSQENMDQFVNWCEEYGHSEILNRTVSANFKKGEEEEATRAASALRDKGIICREKIGVHPSTLRAWVKGLMMDGEEIPDENVCKVNLVRRAKLK
tara:strand:+ start:128 stop:631 length:504 start_codon:yes stop_codon:yes gene_type:complete